MKIKIIISLCLILAAILLCKPNVGLAQNKTQLRTGVNVGVGFHERFVVYFDQEFRVGNETKDYYVHADSGITYRLIPWLNLGIFLRYIREREAGSWVWELRPYFQATLGNVWRHFGLLSRNRFEYRLLEDRSDSGRYRNRLDLVFPANLGFLVFQPYVADEIFIRLEGEGFEQNRVYGGMVLGMVSHTAVDIYYFWERDLSVSDTMNRHVVGIQLKLRF